MTPLAQCTSCFPLSADGGSNYNNVVLGLEAAYKLVQPSEEVVCSTTVHGLLDSYGDLEESRVEACLAILVRNKARKTEVALLAIRLPNGFAGGCLAFGLARQAPSLVRAVPLCANVNVRDSSTDANEADSVIEIEEPGPGDVDQLPRCLPLAGNCANPASVKPLHWSTKEPATSCATAVPAMLHGPAPPGVKMAPLQRALGPSKRPDPLAHHAIRTEVLLSFRNPAGDHFASRGFCAPHQFMNTVLGCQIVAEQHGYIFPSNAPNHDWLWTYGANALPMSLRNFSTRSSYNSDRKPSLIYGGVHLRSMVPDRVWPAVQARLREHEEDFCSRVPLRCAAVTLNCGGKMPPADDDGAALAHMFKSNVVNRAIPLCHGEDSDDIIFVALQETCPLYFAVDVTDTVTLAHHHAWTAAVKRALAAAAGLSPEDRSPTARQKDQNACEYRLVAERSLVGLQLLAFVRESLADQVAEVHTGAIRCGALGAGNKGAVAARFAVFDTSVCFVNCHLPHGEAEGCAAERAKAFLQISEFLRVDEVSVVCSPAANMVACSALAPDDVEPAGECGQQNGHTVQVVGGVVGSRTYLSAAEDGKFVNVWNAEDGSGRQIWLIRRGPASWYNIQVSGGTTGGRIYLSANGDGSSVDLWATDDCSGRQRWILTKGTGDWYTIQVSGGVSGGRTYLSTTNDGSSMNLWTREDGTGRQRWKITNIQSGTFESSIETSSPSHVGGRNIFEHDIVVCAGDFNARMWSDASMSEPLHRDALFAAVDDETKLSKLLQAHDELHLMREQNSAAPRALDDFSGAVAAFQESPVRFAPTYKLKEHVSDSCSPSAFSSKREPAYTDRVLWRVRDGACSVEPLAYERLGDVAISDHRPVRLSVRLMVNALDWYRIQRLVSPHVVEL